MSIKLAVFLGCLIQVSAISAGQVIPDHRDLGLKFGGEIAKVHDDFRVAGVAGSAQRQGNPVNEIPELANSTPPLLVDVPALSQPVAQYSAEEDSEKSTDNRADGEAWEREEVKRVHFWNCLILLLKGIAFGTCIGFLVGLLCWLVLP